MKLNFFLFFFNILLNQCSYKNKNIQILTDFNDTNENENLNNKDEKKLKLNKNKKLNKNNKDKDENKDSKNNNKYYLSSGYDIDLPLNIEWANCNCSYLGLFRFFLSDNYFLYKLINKKTSIFTEDQKKNL